MGEEDRICECAATCWCECACGAWDDSIDEPCYSCGVNGGWDEWEEEAMTMTEEDWRDIEDYESGGQTVTEKAAPLAVQVGGSHYKDCPIQPVEYCQRNRLPFGESCVVKYVSRHMSKNGIEDLRKAKHFLQLIAEIEYGEEL